MVQSHAASKVGGKNKSHKPSFPDAGAVGMPPMPGYGVEQSVDDKTRSAMYGQVTPQRAMMAPMVPPYGAFDGRPSYGGGTMSMPSVRPMLPSQQGQGHPMGVPHYPVYGGGEWKQQSVMDSQSVPQQQQQRVGGPGGDYAAYQQQRVSGMPDMYSHPQQQQPQGDMHSQQQQQMVPQTMRQGGMTMEQYMYAKQCSDPSAAAAAGSRPMPRTMSAQQHMVNFGGGMPVPDPYQAPTPAMWGPASLPGHPDSMYR
jgi:hypothetical protein